MDERLAANRANWDERVPIHVASEFYDLHGWLAEARGPREREVEALGDVAGLDVVHLQCHFGMDTLALARAGARVTGLDFSSNAVAQARDLAERAGLAEVATFVEADVHDAAAVLAPQTFDLVYVSLGALCWLPVVARWAEQVGALLRPGGRLYLHEVHPYSWTLGVAGERVEDTYYEEPEPYVDDNQWTYTDGPALEHTRTYEWNHGLGEVIDALLAQGLRLDRLIEHDWTVFQQFEWLERQHDDLFTIPAGRPRVPLTYTLLASRPAGGAPAR